MGKSACLAKLATWLAYRFPQRHSCLFLDLSSCLARVSDHLYVAQHRDFIHKLGVTGSKVEARIANVEHDSTCLLGR